MRFIQRFFLFLIFNFAALAIGSQLMGDAVTSSWYQGLNKAPWTPPGWVFGATWTTVMLTFSVFMAYAVDKYRVKTRAFIWTIFTFQWVLNVVWNYIFFNQQLVLYGLINIVLLLIIIYTMFFWAMKPLRWRVLWVLPYAIWIVIATSLNGYILLNN